MLKKNKFPLISVIIPTYDSGRTIRRCLSSLKKQTYKNLEIIVVDSPYYSGANREKCKKIIKKYAKYIVDGPERSIQRNRGIEEARGKFILTIDQDMYLTKNVIRECFNVYKKEKVIALTIPEISIGKGYWTKCVALERYVNDVLENGMNECCRFFKKKDALKIGGYDKSIVGVEDSDFHYKMLKMGKIGKVKSIIYHDEGKTSFFLRVRKKFYYSKAFRKYLKRYPGIATKQFFPIKKSYFKHWKIFVRRPHITVGIIILRSSEVIAGGLGLFLKRSE